MTEKPLKNAAAPIQNQLKQKNITLILNEILDPESIQFEVSEHENQHILAPNENLSEQEKHAKKMRELELQQKYLVMKYQQNEEQRRQIAHQNEEQRRQIAHENEEQRKQERHALEMAQYAQVQQPKTVYVALHGSYILISVIVFILNLKRFNEPDEAWKQLLDDGQNTCPSSFSDFITGATWLDQKSSFVVSWLNHKREHRVSTSNNGK